MITMTGEKMASRVAASILKATGLGELVCNNYSGTLSFFVGYFGLLCLC